MPTTVETVAREEIAVASRRAAFARTTDVSARGEPMTWLLGGALAMGCVMIVGFLLMVVWNGIVTFWPKRIEVVTLTNGQVVAGEPFRSEEYRLSAGQLEALVPAMRQRVAAAAGLASRTLYRIGNFDLYNEDFRWVSEFEVARSETPPGIFFIERLEWGAFVGRIKSVDLAGATMTGDSLDRRRLDTAHAEARARWHRIRRIEHADIGAINHAAEQDRRRIRRAEITHGSDSPHAAEMRAEAAQRATGLKATYERLAAEVQRLKAEDNRYRVTLAEIGGREKTMRLSELVRYYAANELGVVARLGVYLARWAEFLTDSPREANTEGGVLPAIFGTVAMTLLMVLVVAPFGVITAL
ncbi:MAG: phosphate ABC transporter, permease protein PstA, partial [Alphaproteobacteria bacterium]|nr:phosphate ABC transporter, permease protein PstA [Alphaproteobacteria bacterium]